MRLLIAILILTIGCAPLPPPEITPSSREFPEYYIGITLDEFIGTYPEEMVKIAQGYHGTHINFYVIHRGVMVVRLDGRRLITDIYMRLPYDVELERIKELMERKKAIEKGEMTID